MKPTPASSRTGTHVDHDEGSTEFPLGIRTNDAPERNLLRPTLKTTILGCLALMISTPFLINGSLASSVGLYLPLSLALFGILKLEEHGYAHFAGWAFCLTLFSTVCAGVLFFGGIKHQTSVVFATVIIMAALNIGSRAAIFFGLLSGLAVFLLVKAEQFGMAPTPLISISEHGLLSSTLLNLGIVAVVMRRAVLEIDSSATKMRSARKGQEAHARSLQGLHVQVRERARFARKISEIAEAVIHGEFDDWRKKAVAGLHSMFDAVAVGMYQTSSGSFPHLTECTGEGPWEEKSLWRNFESYASTDFSEPFVSLTRDQDTEVFQGLPATVRSALIISIPGRSHCLGIVVVVLEDEIDITSGMSKDLQTLRSILGSSMERSAAERKMRIAQGMETVGRLAGSVAHDFNNLLTTIMGSSQLLLNEKSEDDQDLELLQDITRAADHAALLTRQLLVLSRKQVVLLEPVDLNGATKEFVQMADRMVGENIEINFLPLGSEGYVLADPSNIEQILLNLTVNARDAMPEGGKIEIALNRIPRSQSPLQMGEADDGGSTLALTFSDNGCGMPPHVLSHLFEPFFTTKRTGTGLGLASVQDVLNDLRGKAEVASSPSIGTTFSIFIPESSSVQANAKSRSLGLMKGPGGERILLVDDNDHVRKTLEQVLESAGYRVTVACSGPDALNIINASTTAFDLIVTDIIMPKVSGIDLANRLRATNDLTPILFMSGFADSAQNETGKLGDFISKPFTSFKLLNNIELILASERSSTKNPRPETEIPALSTSVHQDHPQGRTLRQ